MPGRGGGEAGGRRRGLGKFIRGGEKFGLRAGEGWGILAALWGEQQPFTVTRLWGAALFLYGNLLGGVYSLDQVLQGGGVCGHEAEEHGAGPWMGDGPAGEAVDP
jgi:hypothetical protein